MFNNRIHFWVNFPLRIVMNKRQQSKFCYLFIQVTKRSLQCSCCSFLFMYSMPTSSAGMPHPYTRIRLLMEARDYRLLSVKYVYFSNKILEVDRYIGLPIYRADIWNFLIYQHRPISVFSSADLKSGTSAGSPMLLVRWNVRCCM